LFFTLIDFFLKTSKCRICNAASQRYSIKVAVYVSSL